MCKSEQLVQTSPNECQSADQRKAVLIVGITSQLGSYLAELLLSKGYEVHGLLPATDGGASKQAQLLNHFLDHLRLHTSCDLDDPASLEALMKDVRPVEVYNLEARLVPSRQLLEAVQSAGLSGFSRYLEESPCPVDAASPPALDGSVKHHREVHGMFAIACMLCSHESPRCRGASIARRITSAVARIVAGLEERIEVANLDSKRDWGHARDYAKALWMALQQHSPEDVMIAAGEPRTVRDFCTLCFQLAGLSLEWRGEGVDEVGVNKKTGAVLVSVSGELPHDTTSWDFCLEESPRKAGGGSTCRSKVARDSLGWVPEVCFEGLASTMLEHDFLLLGETLPGKA